MWKSEICADLIYRAAMDIDSTSTRKSLEHVMDIDSTSTKTSLEHRRILRFYIQKIFKSDCEVFSSQYLQNIRVPRVNSSSDSIIVIADINMNKNVMKTDVIFKITFKSFLNQYEVENTIYELLTQYKLPFVMQHLHTFYCTTFLKHTYPSDIAKRLEVLRKEHGNKYDWNQSQIIMCERGDGHSLHDCVQKNLLKSEDYGFIYLQVIFCLGFFEDIGIVHHDLHLGNVWIDRSDKFYKYRLFIHKTLPKPIEFVTNILVKIYDFDHSTLSQTFYNKNKVVNNMLEAKQLCKMGGLCNQFTYGRDYYQFAWWMYHTGKLPSLIKTMIEQSVNPAFLQNRMGKEVGSLFLDGHPCVVTGASCQTYPRMSSVNPLLRQLTHTTFNGDEIASHLQEFYLPSYDSFH